LRDPDRRRASASTISGNPTCEVVAGTAIELHPPVTLAGDDAEAVVLDLVQPLAAGRQLIGFGREARRDEPGRQGTLQHAETNKVAQRALQLGSYSHTLVSGHRRGPAKQRWRQAPARRVTRRVGALKQASKAEGRRQMTAVWIMLFVCVSSSPSCSQGDVSVANTSYASSEECYGDGMKRARGRIVVCIEGKQGQ
jgi:hypothetical protein